MHATLADVIADTAQNSIEAGAKHVTLTLVEDGATIAVTITDDGKGMDEATQARAFNPFYTEAGKHDKRKVGLGLPILKQLCEATDGAVSCGSICEESCFAKAYICAWQVPASPFSPSAFLPLSAVGFATTICSVPSSPWSQHPSPFSSFAVFLRANTNDYLRRGPQPALSRFRRRFSARHSASPCLPIKAARS